MRRIFIIFFILSFSQATSGAGFTDINEPPLVSRSVVRNNYAETNDDKNSTIPGKACVQSCAKVAPKSLSEEQKQHRLYMRFVALIKNSSVSDEKLRDTFHVHLCRGIDLDSLHPSREPSLAVVLVQVTRPEDFTYMARNITKNSLEDKYRDSSQYFRYLGNDLFPEIDPFRFDLDNFYDAEKVSFKGSLIEQKAKIFLDDLSKGLTSERNQNKKFCCTIQ